jgi:acyl carrier protein
VDNQVKLRGYRIELGEIEARLEAHPSVRDAVVIAREDTPGDKRLVAYLLSSGAAGRPHALREHLEERLPTFMVPAHFVRLDALPAHAQQEGGPQGAAEAGARLPPRRAPRRWPHRRDAAADRRGLDAPAQAPDVGARDNFFDLGGHSLLAVQAHRRLKEVLQRDLSITDLFRFPTVQSLSAYLGNEGEDDAAAQSGKARAQGRRAAMQRRRATADADEQG